MTDGSPDSTSTRAVSDAPSSPGSSPVADDFHPDVPADLPIDPVATPDPSAPTNGGSSDSDLETTAFAAGDPIEFDPPNPADSESSAQSDEQHLVPGATIAGGRYRLLVFHGGPPHLQFWHAMDTALDRQVALTFIDPDAVLPDDELTEILSRTMKLSPRQLGVARMLDVARTGSGGLVVSEWIRGGSLAEVADTSPSAAGGARAVQSLAAAAEAAHRAGVALSIDHPGRIRVSIEGDVVLAFPATLPSAQRTTFAASEPRCTHCWSTGGRCRSPACAAGWRPRPAIPRANRWSPAHRPRHPVPDLGGRRAPSRRTAEYAAPQRFSTCCSRPPPSPTAPSCSAPINENTPPPKPARPDREPPPPSTRRRPAFGGTGHQIGVGAGAAVILVALVVLASVLSRMFSDVGGLDKDQLGLNGPSASNSGEGAAAGSSSNRWASRCTPPAVKPTTPRQPRSRSTAARAPHGRPIPTTTRCRSPASRVASA